MNAKVIKELSGKTIKEATLENDSDVCILCLSLSDETDISIEIWSQKPKLLVNLIPKEDNKEPVRLKLR